MTIHGRPGRAPLTRERVLQGALKIADARGLGSLTIRSLATALGVTPMSVYGHVANKGAILDGLVDLVFAEIALPQVTGEWREEMRRRAYSARAALTRHSWAIALMESRRTPGPATLRHHDATLAVLLAAGFSRKVTATAYALLDSYTYGFALQESALLFTESDGDHAAVEPMLTQFAAGEYPHLLEMTMQYY